MYRLDLPEIASDAAAIDWKTAATVYVFAIA